MALERIFGHFKDQKSEPSATYDPNDPESYEAYLQSMFEDAYDYETAILAAIVRRRRCITPASSRAWITPTSRAPTAARIRIRL